MSEIHCRYTFGFGSAAEQNYDLYFDSASMSLLEKSFEGQSHESMKWAELENNKCSHCPLSSEEFKFCPAAQALGKVARKFAEVKSYDETKVAVVTADRTYLKDTSTQEGLQGIFGLIMATCECPYLKFLRPMARFHLPFATSTETMVRSLSYYLLKRYFEKTGDAKEVKIDLGLLTKKYEDVQIVNQHLVERIRSLGKGDADMNAIVILDSFAMLLNMQISGNFADLRPLF